jgi:hypothetical protein
MRIAIILINNPGLFEVIGKKMVRIACNKVQEWAFIKVSG